MASGPDGDAPRPAVAWLGELEQSLLCMDDVISNALAKGAGRWAQVAGLCDTTNIKERLKGQMAQNHAPQWIKYLVQDMLATTTINSCKADEDMPECVKKIYEDVLGALFHGLDKELHKLLMYVVLPEKVDEEHIADNRFHIKAYSYVRAFVLHHWLPYDRSFFGKLKDPVYLFTYFFLCLSIGHSFRPVFFFVLLLFIRFPAVGQPDEFQMVNYILSFKGLQCFTQGILLMGKGVWKYLYCYSLEKGVTPLFESRMEHCINEQGAGASQSLFVLLADFLAPVVLVWIAWYWLSSTKRFEIKYKHVTHEQNKQSEQAQTQRLQNEMGGRIARLLKWDLRCFGVSVVLLLFGTLATCDFGTLGVFGIFSSQQFKEVLFWSTVLYAFCSIPFALFSIPLVLQLFTDVEFTGYDEEGHIRGYWLPWSDPKLTVELKYRADLVVGSTLLKESLLFLDPGDSGDLPIFEIKCIPKKGMVHDHNHLRPEKDQDLRVGDRITMVNGLLMTSIDEMNEKLLQCTQNQEPITLTIDRDVSRHRSRLRWCASCRDRISSCCAPFVVPCVDWAVRSVRSCRRCCRAPRRPSPTGPSISTRTCRERCCACLSLFFGAATPADFTQSRNSQTNSVSEHLLA